MTFTSNKVFNLGSAAFRQWKATHSHCQYIHGYNLTADVTFETDQLDDKNWCADFGGFKDLKFMLANTFDHKLVVAGDDPQLDLFKTLDIAGVAQLVILPGGVGCERFAEFVLKTADTFIDESTLGRVRVKSVQINEHGDNFATCYRQSEADLFTASFSQTDNTTSAAILEDNHDVVAVIDSNQPEVDSNSTSEVSSVVDDLPLAEMSEPSTPPPNPRAAPVGRNSGTKTKSGWFEGTTWG